MTTLNYFYILIVKNITFLIVSESETDAGANEEIYMKRSLLLLFTGILLVTLSCQLATQPLADDVSPTAQQTLPPEAVEQDSVPLNVESNCQDDDGKTDYIQFDSPFISQEVSIDGKISFEAEWANAFCIDMRFYEWGDIQNGRMLRARWWVQNDEENIYYFARVSKESDLQGIAADYFWPMYTGTWAHSDGVFVHFNGSAQDVSNWDESDFYNDDELSPPGSVDIETAVIDDDGFYWFEIKKTLNSGDSYDWALEPGQVIGYNPSDSFLFALIMEENFFSRNLQMRLGTSGSKPTTDATTPESVLATPTSVPPAELVSQYADEYIRIVLDKTERVQELPEDFEKPPAEQGKEYIVFYLTMTDITDVHITNMLGSRDNRPMLMLASGEEVSISTGRVTGVKFSDPTNITSSTELVKGAECIFVFEIPKGTQPAFLKLIYSYKQDLEEKDDKSVEFEIEL